MPDDFFEVEHTIETQRPATVPISHAIARSRLVVMSGKNIGEVFTLRGSRATLGRADDATITFDASDISRLHARLFRREGDWWVEDLESRNGTYLNGVPLVGKGQPLSPGDELQLGASVLLAFVVQREVERRVMQLQKMEALGQLAGGLAHDLNNMLCVLTGAMEVLADFLDHDEFDRKEARDCLTEAQESVEWASGLTQRLMDLSRTQRTFERVDLGQCVRDSAKLCRGAIDKSITLQVNVAGEITVQGDAGQLQQVLVNLLMNARDAVADRSERTISISAAAIAGDGPDAGRALVEVRDTGCGMDKATREQAFEPFFTTKGERKGTGLGLATVNSIISRHGGAVEVDSEVDLGTCFRVFLPLHNG